MRSQPAFSFSASLRRIPFVSPAGAAVLGLALSPVGGDAQWTNRYPKVAGYGHHVYLEGYELPVLTAGPIDPAPSPDGERVAFASHGWIWVMDLASGVARRLTRGGGIDARPAWSPDGELVAFVRDDTEDTEIVWVAANGGAELGRVDSPGLELDPAFSADGTKIFYSSAQSEAGALDLWAVDIESGERRPVTDAPGIELKPHPPERALVYLWEGGGRRWRGRASGRLSGAADVHRGEHRVHGAARPESRWIDRGGQLADPGGVGPPASQRGGPRAVHPAGLGRPAAHAGLGPIGRLGLLRRGR